MPFGYVTAAPNEVLIVSGCGRAEPKRLVGGRVFVFPFAQRIQRLSLKSMTLNVQSPKVYTKYGVPVVVSGIAVIKVESENETMLKAAIMQLLDKNEQAISRIAVETLEGHQRAILGTMTVEEIFQDRRKFAAQVFDVATRDLTNMGLTIVSYTIQNISDEVGYLTALGMSRTAAVQRDAAIGEAEAKRDSGIKQSLAEQERLQSKFQNEIGIAKSQRDYDINKANYDIEVNTRKAESELAYSLQEAKTKQRIREEEIQIEVVERRKRIEVQEQEIARRERELEATIKRPAMAESYRVVTISEGEKRRVVLKAEAEAEAIKTKGEAEAFAVRERARAEAERMAKKAEAWKEYKEAALVDMVLQVLPRIAAEVAAPLAETKSITMVSGSGKDVGAAKLTSEIVEVMNRLPDAVKRLTGVDVSSSIQRATSATTSAAPAPQALATR